MEQQTKPGELYPTGLDGESTAAPDEEAVSAEEQAAYDQFVTRAMQFVEQNPVNMVRRLSDKNRPVFQNVGQMTYKLGRMVADSAAAAGQEIDPDVAFHAGEELVSMLMELGDAAGLWPFKQDSAEYEESMAMALMEASRLAGEDMLESPDAAQYSDEAGNVLATRVAEERERGEVPDEFFEGIQTNVRDGVRRAVYGS